MIRRVFDASGEAMFALDLNGMIVQANAHALRMLGVTPADVKGHSFADFLKGGSTSRSWKTIQNCLNRAVNDPVDRSEVQVDVTRTKEQSPLPCKLTLSPVPFDDGEPIVSVVMRPKT